MTQKPHTPRLHHGQSTRPLGDSEIYGAATSSRKGLVWGIHTDTHRDTQTHTQTKRHTHRHTQRHTDTDRHRHTHTHTHRHTQTQRHTDRNTQTQTDTETHRHTQTHTHRDRDTHTGRHTRTQTQTHRHRGTHRDTQTQTDTQTDTHRGTDTETHTDTHSATHRRTHTRPAALSHLGLASLPPRGSETPGSGLFASWLWPSGLLREACQGVISARPDGSADSKGPVLCPLRAARRSLRVCAPLWLQVGSRWLALAQDTGHSGPVQPGGPALGAWAPGKLSPFPVPASKTTVPVGLPIRAPASPGDLLPEGAKQVVSPLQG